MVTINDYFTPASIDNAGSIKMLEALEGKSKKALYVTNEHGIKLLKIAIKNEEGGKNKESTYAQLKIIRYGFNKAILWENKPSDPRKLTFHKDVEITYHGSSKDNQTSKIHLKTKSKYLTLMDQALELPVEGIEQPAPLFALEFGYFHEKKTGETKVRGGHVVSPSEDGPVRFEFYMMSQSADVQAFFNSTYFINLLFSQDYLSTAQSGILTNNKIIAPILFLPMGNLWLVVKRSASHYEGQPRLVFYNNRHYQNQWLNRRTAYKRSDGTFVWSTMREDEERLRSENKI